MKRLIVIFALMFTLSAQGGSSITIDSQIEGANNISLNDFDLLGSGNVKQMFSVNLTLGQSYANFKLKLELTVAGKKILTAFTENISNVTAQTKSFSNLDFGKRIFISRSTGGDAQLKFGSANMHGTKLFDGLSISPKLPEGLYQLKLTALNGGAIIASGGTQFRIQNDWSILLSDPAGDISNPYPTFRWSGTQDWFADKATAPVLVLFVYEDKGELATSIGRTEILQERFLENTSQFTFPSDNPRQLEAGKSYYWTIKTHVRGAGGFSFKENEYIKFTFNSGSTASDYDDTLQEIIGPAYLQVKKELAGYKLKTVKATMNGVTQPAGLNLMKKAVKAFKEQAQAKGKTARINVETID